MYLHCISSSRCYFESLKLLVVEITLLKPTPWCCNARIGLCILIEQTSVCVGLKMWLHQLHCEWIFRKRWEKVASALLSQQEKLVSQVGTYHLATPIKWQNSLWHHCLFALFYAYNVLCGGLINPDTVSKTNNPRKMLTISKSKWVDVHNNFVLHETVAGWMPACLPGCLAGFQYAKLLHDYPLVLTRKKIKMKMQHLAKCCCRRRWNNLIFTLQC